MLEGLQSPGLNSELIVDHRQHIMLKNVTFSHLKSIIPKPKQAVTRVLKKKK